MSKPTPTEIAVEISMLRASWPGPVMLVEGPDDARILGVFYPDTMVRIVPSFGCESLLEVIRIVYQRGVQGILGVIDRDYRSALGKLPKNPHVFVTDSHDIETMMFESGAFARVIAEKGSTAKVSIWPSGLGGIKDSVYSAARNIASLRFHSAKEKLNLRFDDLKFEKFANKQKVIFQAEAFIRHIRGKWSENKAISPRTLAEAALTSSKVVEFTDNSQFCCGHDVARILAIGLRSAWGTHNAKAMTGEEVESLLRIAYSREDFMNSDLAQSIQDWFSANAENYLIGRG